LSQSHSAAKILTFFSQIFSGWQNVFAIYPSGRAQKQEVLVQRFISIHRQSGFSIIELLVALTIMIMAASLVLPAVQFSREMARRGQCIHRLKQLGLANLSYHNTFGTFPPMRTGTRRGKARSEEALELSNEYSMSGLVSLTPYLEERSVFQAAADRNFGPVPWRTAAHWKVQVAGLLCPSDSVFARAWFGQSSYKFCVGTTVRDNHSVWGGANNGIYTVIGLPRAKGMTVRLRDVRDGAANTIAMSERRNGNREVWHDIANVANRVADADSNEPAEAYRECWAVADQHSGRRYNDEVSIRVGPRPGERWADGRPYFAGFTTIVPPNGPSCLIGSTNVGRGIFTPSSRHPGLVNVLLVDGSIRQIVNEIDLATWWALGTRAGSEAPTSDHAFR
jgi:prepilin-type processing-associated H-X9-DG protein